MAHLGIFLLGVVVGVIALALWSYCGVSSREARREERMSLLKAGREA